MSLSVKSCWLTFSHSYSGVSGKVGDKFMSTVVGDISKGLYKKYCGKVEELKHTYVLHIFLYTLYDDADKQIFIFIILAQAQ